MLTLFLAALLARLLFFALLTIVNAGADTGFANGICRWDCGWYRSIVENGYDIEPGRGTNGAEANWAFFPLFPLLVRLVSSILPVGPVMAGAALSMFAYAATAPVLYAGYQKIIGPDNALFLAAAVAVTPFGLYGTVLYTEALFGLLLAIAVTAALDRRWIIAAAAAILLGATRVTGVFIVLPFAIIALRQFSWRQVLTDVAALKPVLAIAVAPLGAFVYMLFLYHHVGDALAFRSVQVAWERGSDSPLEVLSTGFGYPLASKEFYWAASALAGLLLTGILFWRNRFAEGAAYFVSILIPLSTGLFSLGRYLFTSYLPYLALAVLPAPLNGRMFRAGILALMLAGWYFFVMGWIEQARWVI
ncbi:mannosyltransferase family protein [Aquisalinus flavus]|uniref:Membrane protein n=1 Tax=Aquisalinus flavus TaxID=1526572 RepID=A0A8J2V4J7_9PROT|nr:mannosyltransferase family protein [Aquisalinus flavus]MBD0426240.1 hypothetical protein [Aquisalinus flavus]UNE48188.1 hypothetical protein FF099_09055 [Aquisalinus flavus]GGD09509.1 membrane protein [Aquisalinus flavus]